VAILGGGISGVYSANLLQKDHDVVLFEAEERLGGHARSILLSDGRRVDMGFMVFNEGSYPLFMDFLRELGVERQIQYSEMSFSVLNEVQELFFGLNRGFGRLFHQKKNLVRPRFYLNFLELLRFRRQAWCDLQENRLQGQSLEEYLSSFSPQFIENILLPICISVWSVTPEQILKFPAKTLVSFLANHGYLRGDPGKRWRTLRGSSEVYLNAFKARFGGELRLGFKVGQVIRQGNSVSVCGQEHWGHEVCEQFDAVICALPANRVLEVIASPTTAETGIFRQWRYEKTQVTLHTDPQVLGAASTDARLWSSWNILRDARGYSVTYYLNRVQSLPGAENHFVTLGPPDRIDPQKVIMGTSFAHPVLDFGSVSTQESLRKSGDQAGIFYCGSYFGYGFHEDAIRSALEASRACLLRCSGSSRES
jgi:predicted NAD/FAD-binding protein